MPDEKRRIKRVLGDLSVKLTLRDKGDDGEVLFGPVDGILNNLSAQGMGFTVPHIHFGEFHLVYSAQDEENPLTLFVEIFPPEEPEKAVSIPVIPVWFDTMFMGEVMSFRIGVEFMESTSDERVRTFEEMVRKMSDSSGSWWGNLFAKLWPHEGN